MNYKEKALRVGKEVGEAGLTLTFYIYDKMHGDGVYSPGQDEPRKRTWSLDVQIINNSV